MEEDLLVPDDVLQEGPVGERVPADRMGGEAREVEPVAGEPVGPVGEAASVACDMD